MSRYPIHIVSGLYTSYHVLLAYCYLNKAKITAPEVIIKAISTFFDYSLAELFFILEKYTPTTTAVK